VFHAPTIPAVEKKGRSKCLINNGRRRMLKVNDRFTIDKDKYNIIIIETYMGKDKNKKPKQKTRETYHATLLQACGVIIDRSGEGKTVEDVVDAINAAKRDILNALKEGNHGK
jgi:hypothetical protein